MTAYAYDFLLLIYGNSALLFEMEMKVFFRDHSKYSFMFTSTDVVFLRLQTTPFLDMIGAIFREYANIIWHENEE